MCIRDRHLQDIIKQVEADEAVELTAIGIGHDVTQYYKRAATISNVNELAGVMTNQLVELFNQAMPAKSGRNKKGRSRSV